MARSVLIIPDAAAAAFFLLLLLLLGTTREGRCQPRVPDRGAPPPLPAAQQSLEREIERVASRFTDEVQRKYGFCMANAADDLNRAFNFTADPRFATDCMDQTRGQMVSMLCWQGEVELYVKTLASTRNTVRVSPNCNQNSWASGCQPGWACSTTDIESAGRSEIPSRALLCRPCCPGFFCPRGLTCMMPCPLGAYCPLGTLNDTTGLCDPYFYQVTPGPTSECGTADSWADVVSTNDIFCPPGHYCPTTTQKHNCSKGYFCRKGSTDKGSMHLALRIFFSQAKKLEFLLTKQLVSLVQNSSL